MVSSGDSRKFLSFVIWCWSSCRGGGWGGLLWYFVKPFFFVPILSLAPDPVWPEGDWELPRISWDRGSPSGCVMSSVDYWWGHPPPSMPSAQQTPLEHRAELWASFPMLSLAFWQFSLVLLPEKEGVMGRVSMKPFATLPRALSLCKYRIFWNLQSQIINYGKAPVPAAIFDLWCESFLARQVWNQPVSGYSCRMQNGAGRGQVQAAQHGRSHARVWWHWNVFAPPNPRETPHQALFKLEDHLDRCRPMYGFQHEAPKIFGLKCPQTGVSQGSRAGPGGWWVGPALPRLSKRSPH